MTDMTRRAGGAPVSQDAPVATDGVSIQGNGTQQFPLHAIQGGGQTMERVVITNSGSVDPTIDISFVSSLTDTADVLLADGQTDGFRKTIVFAFYGIIAPEVYSLQANMQVYNAVGFPPAGGGITLVWNASLVTWQIISGFLEDPQI
jgi:hypothetical protein